MKENPLQEDRIFSIDVLRGIALLGILFVNIFSFHTPYLYGDLSTFAKSPLDRWVFTMIDLFVQASFYPLFAMLFGYSFLLLKEKLDEKGGRFYTVTVRRMLILLIIGLIHATVVWAGDILVTYAVFGFLLIMFINLSAKVLTTISILLYTIPNLWLFYQMLPLATFISKNHISVYDESKAAEVTAVYQHGSFLEVTVQRLQDWYLETGSAFIMLMFMVFPLFLFGVSLAKTKRLVQNKKNDRFWSWVLIITLPTGLLLKLIPYIFEKNIATEHIQNVFGGSILTLTYISIIYLLCYKGKLADFFGMFRDVGKISLTNYLFQSILCSFIFYSYGLGLYGQISYTESTLLAGTIYLLQMVISRKWLNHYQMGPMEWIWRRFTYGNFSQIKKKGV